MSQKCGTRKSVPIMNEHEKVPSMLLSHFLSFKLCASLYVGYVCAARQLYNEKCEKKARDRNIQNEE